MEQSDYIFDLFQHMSWADAKVWQAVLCTKETGCDKKISYLLYHMHLVQRAFLSLWKGEKVEAPELTSFKDLKSVSKWGYEYHQDLGIFLKSLKEQDKDLNLKVPWSKWFEEKAGREVSPITIGESMLQVAMHSQYHRGQINSRLRELSGEPPMVDFIAWIWLGKPVAKWVEE